MFEDEVRRRIRFAPAPAWVRDVAFTRLKNLAVSWAFGGFYTWLIDDQARLDPRPQRYHRTIKEVVHSSALQELAGVTFPFDPDTDDVIVHHVRILRGEEVIEVDAARRYLVMRHERAVERLALDGRWTFAMTIRDLRVGDIIDVAMTLRGDPACFQGEFSLPIPLQGRAHWHHRHVRLMIPPDRQIYIQPFPAGGSVPKTGVLPDGYSEIQFELFDVPACAAEEAMPGWVLPEKGVFASSIASWERVNDLLRAGFEGDVNYPDGLLQVMAAIEAAHPQTRDRIVAAVRWVQTHIRYLDIPFGVGSFVPRSLVDIFAERTGDSKDQSKLIVAMLRRMGVEAWPALVDAHGDPNLVDTQPRLGAFNHCISMCVFEGRRYGFGSMPAAVQGGDLDHMAQTDFGYALLLKPGAGLERMMKKTPQLEHEVREIIHLSDRPEQQTLIEIDYIYRGARADAVRSELRFQGLAAYLADRCHLFIHRYGANMCMVPQMEDDPLRNEITIATLLTSDDPWRDFDRRGDRVMLSPESAFGEVMGEQERERRYPYDLGDVRQGRVTTLVQTALKLDWLERSQYWDFGGLKLGFAARRTPHGYESIRDYTVSRPWLWAQEKRQLDQARDELMAFDRVSVRRPA